MDEVWLRVGEVARRTGLTVRTLHHYDELGLLVPSGRSAVDYRLYSEADLRRLLDIQHLKGLGMSLDEIADALDDPAFDAAGVIERHIAAVEARLAAERELLTRLRGLREASETGWDEVLDVIALTQRLQHPDAWVRVRAALDSPTTLPLATLVDSLAAEPDPAVRETLTWAIARHGAAATPALAKLLRSREPGVRAQAAHALSKAGDPAAVPLLAPLVSDADPSVALKAVFAIARLGGTGALAALLQALKHPEGSVRAEAAEAIGEQRGPGALAALTSALADDPDENVRISALIGLSGLPEQGARDAIAGATHSDDPRIAALARRFSG